MECSAQRARNTWLYGSGGGQSLIGIRGGVVSLANRIEETRGCFEMPPSRALVTSSNGSCVYVFDGGATAT